MPVLNGPVSGGILPADKSGAGVIRRQDYAHAAIVFLTTFLVYIWSAPRTVGLEDDGFFILAAYYNGIAHPPGYPLYTFLAHLATLVPAGSIALRVHLFSGFLGALACACLWCIARALTRDRCAAYAAALSLAVSRIFWSQAIIAEVYTLNVFLLLAVFLFILALRDAGSSRESGLPLKFLFLCYGLALCNHWPLVLLSTPLFIAALWEVRERVRQVLMTGLPYLLLGLTPYLWMAVRSQMDPEIIFFGPIESVSDFWNYISRRPYAEVEYSPSAGWPDKIQYLGYVLFETGKQFGPFGWLFVISGLITQWKKLPVNLCTALLLGYLGSSVFLVLVLDFDFDEYHKEFFSVYPLPTYTIAALWLGIGLSATVKLLIQKLAPVVTGRVIPAGLSVLLVISTFSVNAARNYRQADNWAGLYATTVLASLPPDAVLFSAGLAEGAVAYVNKIGEFREDIQLYSAKGVLLKNRLYHPWKASAGETGEAIAEFIQTENRPIYDISGLFPHYERDYYGLYTRLSRNIDENEKTVIILPEFLDYWKFVLAEKPRHPWENTHRAYLLRLGCRLLTMAGDIPQQNRKDNALLVKMHADLCDNLGGRYIMLESIMRRDDPDWDKARELLDSAAGRLDEALLKADVSQLDYYRGMLYLQTGENEKGKYYLEQSLLQWNHPLNKAGAELKK